MTIERHPAPYRQADEAKAADLSPTDGRRRPACPACGGTLVEVKQKLQCEQCRTICETCCEGGRG